MVLLALSDEVHGHRRRARHSGHQQLEITTPAALRITWLRRFFGRLDKDRCKIVYDYRFMAGKNKPVLAVLITGRDAAADPNPSCHPDPALRLSESLDPTRAEALWSKQRRVLPLQSPMPPSMTRQGLRWRAPLSECRNQSLLHCVLLNGKLVLLALGYIDGSPNDS